MVISWSTHTGLIILQLIVNISPCINYQKVSMLFKSNYLFRYGYTFPQAMSMPVNVHHIFLFLASKCSGVSMFHKHTVSA